jgi:hypothetical protein
MSGSCLQNISNEKKSYVMDRNAISDPANSANKDVGYVQILDSLGKGNLVLLAELDLLPSVRTSAGYIEKINTFCSENWDISKCIFKFPPLSSR